MIRPHRKMLFELILLSLLSRVSPQALWTPIYVDSKNQVDLWTQSAQGCKCTFDRSRDDCACCVEEGGCLCGEESPHRCGQCGIHHHCSNMCNMTLDARTLISKSGKSFGQIKSPAMQGPTSCWFTFIPETNQRVEIQIYRLISVGAFNGTSCEKGMVQLVEGTSPEPRTEQAMVCGQNERFAPPVLLFADKGPATLILRMEDPTIRSQMMAYFSFTEQVGSVGPGFQQVGGRRVEETECDWIYKDSRCKAENICLLGSPGFPGVYQPYKKCQYYLATSSPYTSVELDFKVVHLPHNHCETDFIRVYNGSSVSSPLIANICGNRKQKIIGIGDLLLEFSSGPPVHPFDYNGFVAAVFFFNISVPTTKPAEITAGTVQPFVIEPKKAEQRNADTLPVSTFTFYGNESRSGHFDTRSHQCRHSCSFQFIGKPNDVLHLTLLNYHLRAPSCQTTIEVYDGVQALGTLPMKHICSPSKKHTRESTTGIQNQEMYASTGNIMSIVMKRSHSAPHLESEFVDGAFLFHDERLDGTLQPATTCDVDFFGSSSKSVGQIRNPGSQHFTNSQMPLRCTQKFIPAFNQSITLKIVSLSKLPVDNKCQTACGDSGCRCLPTEGNLESVNHLIFSSEDKDLSCLCGDFQQEWLPVGIRSWSPTSIVYSVAQGLWNKGFHYQAEYTFHSDASCGHTILKQHSGQVSAVLLEKSTQLNYFYYQSCTWALYSNVKRQLTVDVESDQNRPCSAWNITLHEYTERSPDNTGKLLYTFCSRDKNKSYALPQELYMIVIRLNGMTRILPSFSFKWKSQIIRNNPHLAGVVPAQSSSTNVISCCQVLLIVTMLFQI